MTKYTITIVSDTVCPWCYIGYRRLKAAISQHLSNPKASNDTFTIQWQPFQLNPSSPRGQSVDKTASYVSRYGAEQAEQIFHRLRSAAKQAGIEFSFGGCIGNTLDSHRLIEYAQQQDQSEYGRSGHLNSMATRVAEELFKVYFEQEQDITEHSVLIKAAVRAGLDEKDVGEFLQSDDLLEEVAQEAKDSREQGISGVPYFIINETFTVEGAQEPSAFMMLFNRLKKREASVL